MKLQSSKTPTSPLKALKITSPDTDEALDTGSGKPPKERFKPLTFRSATEIMKYVPDDDDLVLTNGYLCKGERTTLLGQGGLGKSRLSIQFACCCILGHDFLGVPTRGQGQKWLFLQTENGMRRLKYDLDHMSKAYTASQWITLGKRLLFHTLEGDEDGVILLSEPEHFQRAEELILQVDADVIVIDPLRDSHSGDLSSDAEMTMATRNLTRLSKVGGRADRCLLVLHHALTGKAGAAKATGYDRASFGRNSKVLQGWTRAQINVAPGSPDNGDLLVISSGKNNNFREFPPYAIRLNQDTMTYEIDEDFDMDAWQTEMSGSKKGMAKMGEEEVIAILEAAGGRLEKKVLHQRAMSKSGRGEKHTSTVLKEMIDSGDNIREVREPRSGKPAAVFVELNEYEAPSTKEEDDDSDDES